MTAGLSTRAIKGPTASAGAHGRVSGGREKPGSGDRGVAGETDGWRGKYVPLSVFFARMDAMETGAGDPDAVYGYSKKRKEAPSPQSKADADEKSKSAKDKNADANRQNTPRSGSTTTAGDAKTAGQALDQVGQRQEAKERSFKPPKDVQRAAAKGLELRRKHGRGGLDTKQASEQGVGSGVQRAVNLKNGDPVSLETVQRMRAFFARHEKNKGKPGDTTPGRIAWLLWGGNAGRAWADRVLKGLEEAMAGQGLPVRSGASHVASGGAIHGTGAGNIATAPVPLGPPLRRADWLRALKKKKRKKKSEGS